MRDILDRILAELDRGLKIFFFFINIFLFLDIVVVCLHFVVEVNGPDIKMSMRHFMGLAKHLSLINPDFY